MAEEIIFEFSADGATTKITTKGFKGRKCKQVTASIEKALGTVVKDEPTSEMYQTESLQQKVRS